MLNINKILLPVDFPNTSLRVVLQAAKLARRFHSEIVMLHVVTALSHQAGVPRDVSKLGGWDLLAEIIRRAENKVGRSFMAAIADLDIKRVLAKGRVAPVIVQTAREEEVDLIMMPSHGTTFSQFLMGSVTTKVLKWSECPVWTDAHVEESPVPEFDIRHVLCAVDFTDRNRKAVLWAAQMAAEFGARLTLAHVTPSMELWGPGGNYVKRELQDELVCSASERIAELRHAMAIQSDVFIGSGDVPMVLSQAVKRTNADLLVTGCRPYGLHMRTHGFAIICAVPIPVLSI